MRLLPGQITDDSEMAMCLVHGLTDPEDNGALNLDRISYFYKKWFDSQPIDMGFTTRAALANLKEPVKFS